VFATASNLWICGQLTTTGISTLHLTQLNKVERGGQYEGDPDCWRQPVYSSLYPSSAGRRSDFKVCGEAENGREAIAMAQRLRPDAVVLDLVIPVVNGLDAARDIRCSVPETRLILFSGYAEELADFEMQSAGFAAQVSKDENIAARVQKMRGLFCSSAP